MNHITAIEFLWTLVSVFAVALVGRLCYLAIIYESVVLGVTPQSATRRIVARKNTIHYLCQAFVWAILLSLGVYNLTVRGVSVEENSVIALNINSFGMFLIVVFKAFGLGIDIVSSRLVTTANLRRRMGDRRAEDKVPVEPTIEQRVMDNITVTHPEDVH